MGVRRRRTRWYMIISGCTHARINACTQSTLVVAFNVCCALYYSQTHRGLCVWEGGSLLTKNRRVCACMRACVRVWWASDPLWLLTAKTAVRAYGAELRVFSLDNAFTRWAGAVRLSYSKSVWLSSDNSTVFRTVLGDSNSMLWRRTMFIHKLFPTKSRAWSRNERICLLNLLLRCIEWFIYTCLPW